MLKVTDLNVISIYADDLNIVFIYADPLMAKVGLFDSFISTLLLYCVKAYLTSHGIIAKYDTNTLYPKQKKKKQSLTYRILSAIRD